MNLTIETTLHGIAIALRERIAPAIDDAFVGEVARLTALLLTISANAVDDAAAVRVWENAALRALFADGRSLVDDDLARRLDQAADSVDPGLRISELDRENGRLRRLLVELHAAVDANESSQKQLFSAKIWRFLREVEDRRAPRS
jgi:hypothetical protein